MSTPEPAQPRKKPTAPQLVAVTLGFLGIAWALNIATSDGDPYGPTGDGSKTVTAHAPPPTSLGVVTLPQQIVVAAGPVLPCADARVIVSPVDAKEQINCDSDRVIIRVYDTTDPGSSIRSLALLGLNKATFLAGENWTISADDTSILPAAQRQIGGKLTNLSEP